MIGQKNLLSQMVESVYKNDFPKFVILLGEEGSGKRTLCKELSKHWKFYYECSDTKVATIRNMIDFAYQTKRSGECLFCIPDSQKMSLQAKNSILKIVEEPPKYATFILTAQDSGSILPTIRSRAVVYNMERYSLDELKEAVCGILNIASNSIRSNEVATLALSVSDNIQELKEAVRIDPGFIRHHISVVIDKADAVSIANLLKSTHNMDIKGEDAEGKLNIKMFFKAFMQECLSRMKSSEDEVDNTALKLMIVATDTRLSELAISGINKTMVYENWLLDIRQIRERCYEY